MSQPRPSSGDPGDVPAGASTPRKATPSRPMCDTRAVSTAAGDAVREFPEVPGYEILGELGQGGMGVVYRARQLQANRVVALKMIRPFQHASPHERLRFQIET